MATAYTIRYGSEKTGLRGCCEDVSVSVASCGRAESQVLEVERCKRGGSIDELLPGALDGTTDSGRAANESSPDDVSSVMLRVGLVPCRKV